MSQNPATTTSSSNFTVTSEKALKAYNIKTKRDLITHPLASLGQFQACNSPAVILTILQDQAHQIEQSRIGDERLRRWLNPTTNVLYAFSAILGEGVWLGDFAGASVLLLVNALVHPLVRVSNDSLSAYREGKPNARAQTVPLLLEHGADINTRDGGHKTPLHLASSGWSDDAVKLLIRHGVNVNAQGGRNSMPFAPGRIFLLGHGRQHRAPAT
ncbi:hypothetical protein BJY52DRAFT_1353543 [Lactarius psammicola]|nr:hypothetical protein BJY52DRAFT_1353543 [Lactarius psammicola]